MGLYTFQEAKDSVYSRIRETDSQLLPSTNVKRFLNDAHRQVLKEKYFSFLETFKYFQKVSDANLYQSVDPSDSTLLKEENSGADSDKTTLYGVNWLAQTFTASASYTIQRVALKLYKVGNPGAITIGIRSTDIGGVPTTTEYVTGSIDGNDLSENTDGGWIEFNFKEGYSLTSGTVYSIVLDCENGTTTDYVGWRKTVGGLYAGGETFTSSDSGANFSAGTAGEDFMFRTYPQVSLILSGEFEEEAGTLLIDNEFVIYTGVTYDSVNDKTTLNNVYGLGSQHDSGSKVQKVYSIQDDLNVNDFDKPIYVEMDGTELTYIDGRGDIDGLLGSEYYTVINGYLILPYDTESQRVVLKYKKTVLDLVDDDETFLVPDEYVTLLVEYALYKAKTDLGYEDATLHFQEYQRLLRRMRSDESRQTENKIRRVRSIYQPNFKY